MIHRTGVAVLFALLVIGCGRTQSNDASSLGSSAQPLRPHEFKPVEKATKEIGEDCTAEGSSGCKNSGVCVHVKPEIDQGYVCARTCDEVKDCPHSWNCLQMHPSEKKGLCLPPVGWSPKAAN